MRGKGHAVEFDRVDADVDQQLNAAVALQADGVFSLKQGGHFARERGNHLAHRRDNGDPFTQQAAGEGAIRHLLEGAITLPLIGARISFAEAGATVTAPGAALARGRPAKKVSTQASTKATPVPISPPQTLASIPPGGIICAGKRYSARRTSKHDYY